jgi:hypothetical protein
VSADPAAEALCQAQTPAAYWGDGCQQCGPYGTCNTASSSLTTVWDWLDQVRTANFAGHSDWRLPSEDGCNSRRTGSPPYTCPCDAAELESILAPYPCATLPCIAPIFGPTAIAYSCWSASNHSISQDVAWSVGFHDGWLHTSHKSYGRKMRRGVRRGG